MTGIGTLSGMGWRMEAGDWSQKSSLRQIHLQISGPSLQSAQRARALASHPTFLFFLMIAPKINKNAIKRTT